MKYRAALIDLDGTLLHTVPDLTAACNAMLVDLGREPVPAQSVEHYIGKGVERLVHRCLTKDLHGVAEAPIFGQAMALFNTHYQRENGLHCELYPGVIDGLAAMQAAGTLIACVTNKPHAFAVDLLAKTKLDHYFEFIQGGDVLEHKKPDPLPLLWAASRLGVAVHECVAFGDSVNDCLAAQAAGMAMLLVPYGYNEGQPVTALPCTAIVPTLLAGFAEHF